MNVENEFRQTAIENGSILITTGTLLDNSNAHSLVSAITASHESGVSLVIIDMEKLEFISSAGVGAILGTIELFRERGGDVVLCGISPMIEHVLNTLDVLEYLTIKEDVQSASYRI